MKPEKPKLRCTTDYSKFEPHPHNREIRATKVLEESMRKHGFDPGLAIRCKRNGNGKFQITHGHHRFHVARELGISVWFIETIQDIGLFDSEASNHSWTVGDYLSAMAKAGDENAQIVQEYCDETGIAPHIALNLFEGQRSGGSRAARKLKAGTYKVKDTIFPEIVKNIVLHCKDEGAKFATNLAFVRALVRCLRVPRFKYITFKKKVSANPQLMVKQISLEDYIDMIEKVYNYRVSGKRALYLAHEVRLLANVDLSVDGTS